jgi:hypothetical protein
VPKHPSDGFDTQTHQRYSQVNAVSPHILQRV